MGKNMLFGTTKTKESGQWVMSIKRVQTGVFSATMMMTSVPISRRITGSTGYQPLVNGLMLIRVCQFRSSHHYKSRTKTLQSLVELLETKIRDETITDHNADCGCRVLCKPPAV